MKTAKKLEEIEVEAIVVHRWECPDCGLRHEDENVSNGSKITCSDEERQLGCHKQFKAVVYK
jgi:hypothetical protein